MKQELCNLDFCFWKTNCFKTFLNYNVGTITVKVRYQMNRKVSSKKKNIQCSTLILTSFHSILKYKVKLEK